MYTYHQPAKFSKPSEIYTFTANTNNSLSADEFYLQNLSWSQFFLRIIFIDELKITHLQTWWFQIQIKIWKFVLAITWFQLQFGVDLM